MMRAAVENGADAVYFGLQDFNARLRADNFAATDLPDIMAWLHERGVKGYVALNTLVFCAEMPEAAALLRKCSDAGVDGVMIQDLGLAALAAQMVPELPIHASTQMTLTAPESIHAVEALGLRISRVVAARELSLKQVGMLCRATAKEVEVFVHGALCVAYSGQCLTSEALGGRSANRGECAQACRLPFDLIVDGSKRDLGDVKYLLSPRDLAAYEDLGKAVRAGVASVKIEGRLKSAQYVAATVQSYRQAVAEAMESPGPRMDAPTRRKLEMTFSRGFTGGYLHAIDHQAVVEGRFPKKRGTFLGRVLRYGRGGVVVELEACLKLGDGIVFDSGHPDQDEQGGRVYEMSLGRDPIRSFDPADPAHRGRNEVTLTFGEGRVNLHRVNVGDRVWKTSDPELDRELAASFAGDRIRWQQPVRAVVQGRPGKPLRLELSDRDGNTVQVDDTAPAEHATRQPLSHEALEGQIGRLGNTPFRLESLEVETDGDLMVPFSRLNDLRRRAVDALVAKRRAIGTSRQARPEALAEMRAEVVPDAKPGVATARLSVLCRTLEQVAAAAAHPGVTDIYTDFEDIRVHRDARGLVEPGTKRFIPATLRVMKPGEAGFARKLLKAQPDAVLVRNLAAWQVLRSEAPDMELAGDYSLNVANDLSAAILMRGGFAKLTPGYDLNIDQLLDLLRNAPPDWFEVTIHQHIPMFHMEHCVFCRFLGEGTDYTNCGRPCDTQRLALRDRMGYEHPVKADAGCRNTVYNAVAQSASEYADQLLAAGVRQFRIEFIEETGSAVRDAIDAYLPVIRGEASGHELWRRLKVNSKLGVTRGSLDHE
jgi:putative protease